MTFSFYVDPTNWNIIEWKLVEYLYMYYMIFSSKISNMACIVRTKPRKVNYVHFWVIHMLTVRRESKKE